MATSGRAQLVFAPKTPTANANKLETKYSRFSRRFDFHWPFNWAAIAAVLLRKQWLAGGQKYSRRRAQSNCAAAEWARPLLSPGQASDCAGRRATPNNEPQSELAQLQLEYSELISGPLRVTYLNLAMPSSEPDASVLVVLSVIWLWFCCCWPPLAIRLVACSAAAIDSAQCSGDCFGLLLNGSDILAVLLLLTA